MTTTLSPSSSTTRTSSSTATRQPLWRAGVTAAVAGAVATTVLALLAKGDGVSFADRTGASIPVAGFPELTLTFSLIGLGIAAVLARKARRPRSTFVCTTLALTALSFVPDLTVGFDAASAVTLVTLHTVAASIVVPTLALRLARAR